MPSPSQSPSPWSIKGISPEARKLAKTAAQKSGMTLGQWLSEQIAAAAEAEAGTATTAAAPQAAPPRPDAIRYSGPKDSDSAPGIDVDLLEERIIERIEARMTGRLQDALDDQLHDRLDSFAAEAEERRDELEGIETSVKSLITQLNNRISRTSDQSERISIRLDELAEGLEAGAARALKTETAMRRIAEAIETLNDQVRYTESAAQEASETAKAALAAAQTAAAGSASRTLDKAELDERIEQALRRFAAAPGAADTVDWQALEVPVGPMRDASLWVEIFGRGPIGETGEVETAEVEAAPAPDAEAAPESPWADELDEAADADHPAPGALSDADLPGDIVSRPGFGPTPGQASSDHDDPMPAFVDPDPTRRLNGTPSLQRALSRLDADRQPAPGGAAAGATETAMLAASYEALKQVSEPQAAPAADAPTPTAASSEAPASVDHAALDAVMPAISDDDVAAEAAQDEDGFDAGEYASDAEPDATNARALKKLLAQPEDEWLVTQAAPAAADDGEDDAARHEAPNETAGEHGEERVEPGFSEDAFDAAFGASSSAAGTYSVSSPYGDDADPSDGEALDLSAFESPDAGATPEGLVGFAATPGFGADDDADGFFAKPAAASLSTGESPYHRRVSSSDAEAAWAASPQPEAGADPLDHPLADAPVPTPDAGGLQADAQTDADHADTFGALHEAAEAMTEARDALANAGDAYADDASAEDAFGEDTAEDTAGNTADTAPEASLAMDGVVDWETGEPISVAPAPRPAPTAANAAVSETLRPTPAPRAIVAEAPASPEPAPEPALAVDADQDALADAAPTAETAEQDRPKKSGGARSLLAGLSALGRKPAGPELGDAEAEDPTDVLELDAADILAEDAAFEAQPVAAAKPVGQKPLRRKNHALSDADIDAFEELYANEDPSDAAEASKLGVALSVSLMAVAAAASIAYIYWQGI